MYKTILYLHSHSHHNLWKWLEIVPVTMVYATYMGKLGLVDGINWGVKDRQDHSPLEYPNIRRNMSFQFLDQVMSTDEDA